MNRVMQPALTLFAVGMIGLGVLALIVGDFAMVWQPVAAWVPGRTALAYVAGVLMLVCGAGLLFQATAKAAIRVLFPYLIVWMLLKAPAVVAAPLVEGVWLGIGELVMLMAGGWVLFARLSGLGADRWLGFAVGERGVRLARIVFGLAVVPVGLSHLVYTAQTAEFVPAWLPFHTFWAYLTGVGQVAAGLGIAFKVWPRVAAWAEAGMVSVFTLLIWLPGLVATPRVRMSWTAFWISWAIAAAAWCVAQGAPAGIRGQESVIRGQKNEAGEESAGNEVRCCGYAN